MRTENLPPETLWNLIKDIHFGMLTHRDQTGLLQAHPLATQNNYLGADHELYFFVPKSGELYFNLLTDGNVNLAYSDAHNHVYISLAGLVRFIEDDEKKELLWTPAAADHFPEGATDPDLGLLAVRIRHAERWDTQLADMVSIYRQDTSPVRAHFEGQFGEAADRFGS